MSSAVKINIAPDEIIRSIKALGKKERDALLEDLLAATSPEYLLSIKESRADYKAKRIKSHKEGFWGMSYYDLAYTQKLSEILKNWTPKLRKGLVKSFFVLKRNQ